MRSTIGPRHALFALAATALIVSQPARAQFGGGGGANADPAPKVKLTSPAPHSVYQRDSDGKAQIAVSVELPEKSDLKIKSASIYGQGGAPAGDDRFEDGKLVGVPTGGPYTVRVLVGKDNDKDFTSFSSVSADSIFVGDLWVLAGQSNMEGVGDLLDVSPPNEQVMLLGMDGKWSKAKEPLHWLVDSPDEVHSQNPADRAQRSADYHKTRSKGAGLGLPFADALVRTTGVPIGLVACAHGGTSMAQWDPGKRGEGGKSLYGSFLRQTKLAGGKFKGVLWYQGESDAMNPDATKVYEKTFADFIKTVRDDFGQPELAFYFVQIGRFIRGGSPADWNAVQDAQRRLAEKVPNTAVVASIDLELDDLIHVGTQGLKRLGTRLARIAAREQFGETGATTPTLDRVNLGSGNTLVVKFKGVNFTSDDPQIQYFGGMGGIGGGQAPQGGGFRQVPVRAPATARGPNARTPGLSPSRHIAGFSIRKKDGEEIPLIFDAAVGKARDTVILKLVGKPPEGAYLWYGYGFDPYCNLADSLDMAVPVFGPVALDELK